MTSYVPYHHNASSRQPGSRGWLSVVLFAIGLLPTVFAAPGQTSSHEVVVYGGTAGGVTAAVAAARQGARVVLIEPGSHLGGMTSGGLGATDIGKAESIGGLAREFYQRVKQYYANPAVWKWERPEEYRSHRHDPKSDVLFHFEPHVAERILQDMLREAGVEVVLREQLDLSAGVRKEGAEIREIVMESRRRFGGQVFIDATYEGDLMAKAGVKYRVGREANAEYGETCNGNQPWLMRRGKEPQKADLRRAVDPYVRPGDPASGLLFGVHDTAAGEEGAGDHRVQAYCYRLCLTNVPENRIPFPKPDGYDPARYELLLRHLTSRRKLPEYAGGLAAVEHPVLGNNLTTQPPTVIMPNRKSDSNNKGGVSFDYLGGNFDYPDGDYATRKRIIRDHINWQQGLIWFVANDPRVPAEYREPLQQWGLARDEFADTGHWPHQLYVREARRMVGDYVMREQNCLRQELASDSVGLGSYALDSHSTRRFIDENGHVRNEGKLVATPVRAPYPIAYGALTPRKEQCANLLVPVCLSATHIAYGSIRMEPVYMILGHSAGAAAVQSIREGRAVQDVDRARLRATLLAGKQVLEFDPAPARATVPAKARAASASTPNVILCMTDDQGWGDVGYNGNPVLRTPNLDAMAASGVRFDRFYAAHFVCSPTRASVLTGRHPARYRCYSWGHDLPLGETTVAELARQAGYATGHFGKWHLGGIPNTDGGSGRGLPESFDPAPRDPSHQGFDEWISAGNWFDVDPPAGVFFHNGKEVGARQGDTSDLVMDDALRFIRQQAVAGRPFLCVIWFPSPHSPFRGTAADKAPYVAHPDKADFYAEMAGVDRAMGRLRRELGEIGVRDNTLLWFNSDNGADGGSVGPLTGHKGTLWEGGLRVPGIIEWPARVKQPRRTEFPACTVDILPTVCEALGLPLPDDHILDGRSLLPVLDGAAAPRAQPLGFASNDVLTGGFIGTALVDNDWKLLRLTRPLARERGSRDGTLRPGEYLFDLRADPGERKDLAGERPEVLARLRGELDAFEASVRLSAAAYPLAVAEPILRPVMLQSEKDIAQPVVDRLVFPAPGWISLGQGTHEHADGGLRLRPGAAGYVGIGRTLTHGSVFIEFRFKLDSSSLATADLGGTDSPVCRAVFHPQGVRLTTPSGQVLAEVPLPLATGEWHSVLAEVNARDVVVQVDKREHLIQARVPVTAGTGFGLGAEHGTVWLKDVRVTVGRVAADWRPGAISPGPDRS